MKLKGRLKQVNGELVKRIVFMTIGNKVQAVLCVRGFYLESCL